MNDSWIPLVPKGKEHFFDVITYNFDTINSPHNHNYLAEIYFRVDVNEIIHSRVVFKFMDWLGSIAGIEKFLLKWITFVFGGYINYNASIEIINQQYKNKPSANAKENECGKSDILNCRHSL
jgi:hypothetical protein